MATPAPLGVDVGFSKSEKTTGLVWYAGSTIETAPTGYSWSERNGSLPRDVHFAIGVLDAPIVPADNYNAFRGCERAFYGGAFWNRCRLGLSHHGSRGPALRDAGRQAAQEFAAVLEPVASRFGPCVLPTKPIIEAFPSAFMGLLLPAEPFAGWSKALGKAKSDWLVETAAELGVFEKLLSKLDLASARIRKKFEDANDHDERAALICLLTALFAWSRDAVIVGDLLGGWIWLPPKSLWNPWASTALEVALGPSPKSRFPLTGHWKRDPYEVQSR